MTESPEATDVYEEPGDVPIRAVNTYARLWQLETWLRTMVYVELRALLGDAWGNRLNANSGSLRADKSLTHMPTREMNALSYSQLSKLIELVEAHWDCFAPYLPPQPLWTAKLKEVAQIRHRVAHFRIGHADDLARVKQLLRDVDVGFWCFCTSYNDSDPILPPTRDPVAGHFLPLDPLPWVEYEPKKWAQIGTRDQSLPVGLNVRAQQRPWATSPLSPGEPGHLYDFYLFAQDGRAFEMANLLEQTKPIHDHFVHICVGSFGDSIRLTAPSVLGATAIIDLVERFHEAALNAIRRLGALDSGRATILADTWPEYVLGPDNPLTFLAPDMPCSFFNA